MTIASFTGRVEASCRLGEIENCQATFSIAIEKLGVSVVTRFLGRLPYTMIIWGESFEGMGLGANNLELLRAHCEGLLFLWDGELLGMFSG